jgi:hypothetical protein
LAWHLPLCRQASQGLLDGYEEFRFAEGITKTGLELELNLQQEGKLEFT